MQEVDIQVDVETSDSTTEIDVNTQTQPFIPTGGKPGEVLTKKSDKDFDVSWEEPQESGGGSVDLSDYQKKVDENLPTTNKTIVGAIAEVKEIAETAKMVFGETEGTAYEGNKGKANADNIAKLQNELSIVNATLEQSGLVKKYIQPITQEYNERVTADGANVLDGSKAILKKVVGNTVAYDKDENGLNGKLANASFGGIESGGKNILNPENLSGGEVVTFNEKSCYKYVDSKAAGFSFKASFIENQQYTITAKIYRDEGQTANACYLRVLYTDGTKQEVYFAVNTLKSFTTTAGKTVDYIDSVPNYGKSAYLDLTVTQIEAGTTATDFLPYVASTFDFPKTETPLGTTIDFENKKITDYGVDLVLTGTENWEFYTAVNRHGVRHVNCLANNENYANCVSTDGTKADGTRLQNTIGIGQNNDVLYWYGVLDYLGWTTEGVEPTAEEQATAVANFKGWLAGRYADGNPVTIRYVSSVLQSETDFTANNEYIVYKGGTEKVLDNDGNEYGADNTLTQDYILVTEV